MPTAEPAGKGERTRARVLEVAIRHVAEHGAAGVSVPEIAREVGLSHSALYQHFGRKESLVRAAVDADLTAAIAELDVARRGTVPDQLVALVPSFIEVLDGHPLTARVLAELDEGSATTLTDLPAMVELRSQAAELLRQGQARGEVRADIDPTRAADGLVTVSLSLLSTVLRVGGVLRDLPHGAAALELLTSGLRPERPSRPDGCPGSTP